MTQGNRSLILDKAMHLFAARGYDAVAVQEIVEAAGITKPTLYHYFGNKRGVLDAIFEGYPRPLLSVVEKAVEFHGDLPANLMGLAKAIFEFAQDNAVFYRLLLSTYHAPAESEAYLAAVNVYGELVDIIEELFVKALPHMEGRQRRYAVTFLGMIDTYITMPSDDQTELSNDQIHAGVHQFMHGIYS